MSTFATLPTRSGVLREAEQNIAGRAGSFFSRIGTSVWNALEASGRARAAVELNSLAESFESSQPNLAKELRAAASYQA
ncbi:hypothetical protein BH11PSE9_BH11PSE9_20360 [soil metagenome]